MVWLRPTLVPCHDDGHNLDLAAVDTPSSPPQYGVHKAERKEHVSREHSKAGDEIEAE